MAGRSLGVHLQSHRIAGPGGDPIAPFLGRNLGRLSGHPQSCGKWAVAGGIGSHSCSALPCMASDKAPRHFSLAVSGVRAADCTAGQDTGAAQVSPVIVAELGACREGLCSGAGGHLWQAALRPRTIAPQTSSRAAGARRRVTPLGNPTAGRLPLTWDGGCSGW